MDADNFLFRNCGKSKRICVAKVLLGAEGYELFKVFLCLNVVWIYVLKTLCVKGISAGLNTTNLRTNLFKLFFCKFHLNSPK